VSDYSKSDLKGIDRDIYNMETLLKDFDFHITKLTDSESLNIIGKLKEYKYLNENDTFVFYYSGHGYHIPDKDGDEVDGKDETLVLSNSKRDFLFVDDDLFSYLNEIKAKKLIVLDSCHSGTAFKAFNSEIQVKALPEGSQYELIQTKGFRRRASSLKGGEYIVLSASQDSEVSIATPNGSLFTNALVSNIKGGGNSESILDLKSGIDESIRKYCASRSCNQHPNFTLSNPSLKNISLNEFLNGGANKPKISVKGNKYCKDKSLLTFNINISGGRGYLTIFSIENREPFIMAQTSKPVTGLLNFQEDFNINQPVECYKSCGDCPKEDSFVYIILSDKPLTQKMILTKGLNIDRNNKPITTRAFRHKTNSRFQPIIARVKFTII
jgi:hypothetical protein